MARSPEQMAEEMVAALPATTGKPIEAWTEVVKASGLERHGEIVRMLKADHGITHGYANLIAHMARGGLVRPAQGEDAASGQYDGAKAGLRPIYDALVAAAEGFGDDVELAPKKGYVSLRRGKQFATLHPSTASRFDLGLALKGVEPAGRLEAAGSWNGMVSHRVRLENVDEVDAEVLGWLKAAYDLA
ncbi:MAG: DUF4287 domain-containing protein [Caulobacter sp.]|nr:DUF4287 domain-containing protein [Caulobacter sp.]